MQCRQISNHHFPFEEIFSPLQENAVYLHVWHSQKGPPSTYCILTLPLPMVRVSDAYKPCLRDDPFQVTSRPITTTLSTRLVLVQIGLKYTTLYNALLPKEFQLKKLVKGFATARVHSCHAMYIPFYKVIQPTETEAV